MKKICPGCKKDKKLHFYHNGQGKHGKQSRCIECLSELAKKNKRWTKKPYKDWLNKNKERMVKYSKEWHLKNKERRNKNAKEWYKKNKEKHIQNGIDYRRNNKEKYNKYRKNKRDKNPLYKMVHSLRSRTTCAFKRKKWIKTNKIKFILGCEYETAFLHIQNLFKDGMTWQNHGDWHIDHKIPLHSAMNEGELIKLCHYTNLQPLWKKDNLEKGHKI